MTWEDAKPEEVMEDVASWARAVRQHTTPGVLTLQIPRPAYERARLAEYVDAEGMVDWDRILGAPDNVHYAIPPTRVEVIG